MQFSRSEVANVARMVPGAALRGFVAPISALYATTASSLAMTWATSGTDRLPVGAAAFAADRCSARGLFRVRMIPTVVFL